MYPCLLIVIPEKIGLKRTNMKKVTEHIREHILLNAGMKKAKQMPSLKELRKTEWCSEFERLMRNRFVLGAFRYGTFAEHEIAGGSDYDDIQSAIDRLKKYQKTGNSEHLVDVANLCLKEFKVGNHPKQHWESIDDGAHTPKIKYSRLHIVTSNINPDVES